MKSSGSAKGPITCLSPIMLSGLRKTWCVHCFSKASLVAQMVNNPPAMQEIQVRSLGWEDPLKEGMATYSSILAWRIPWTGEPGGLQSRVTKSRT